MASASVAPCNSANSESEKHQHLRDFLKLAPALNTACTHLHAPFDTAVHSLQILVKFAHVELCFRSQMVAAFESGQDFIILRALDEGCDIFYVKGQNVADYLFGLVALAEREERRTFVDWALANATKGE
jgi:hypothetical protein